MILSVQLQFIAARNFTKLDSDREILWLVLHAMQAPEKGATAENCGAFFKNQPKHGALDPVWCKKNEDGTLKPWAGASAHYGVDSDSIVQYVSDRDVAWHAPGANSKGIGIEHAGFSEQSPEDWNDDFSRSMLELSAQLSADLCVKYGIPPLSLDTAALKAGKRGITTHKAVTDAFSGGRGHWDPGPGFPMANYCLRVAELMVSDMPSEFDPYTLSTYGIVEATLRGRDG